MERQCQLEHLREYSYDDAGRIVSETAVARLQRWPGEYGEGEQSSLYFEHFN